MNGALLEFVAAAKGAELHAIATLRGTLSPDERELTTALLRHAVGIIRLEEKWRKLHP